MPESRVVSQQEWLAARKALLAKEKAFSRQRDELARARRELPRVKIEKNYVFDSPQGARTLAELFGAKSQLIVYHFMLGPGWEAGCKSCSYLADHFDGMLPHLAARDVSFVAVSRAPLASIEKFKRRMGWRFKWVSSDNTDFNYDFAVSFTPEQVQRGSMFYNYQTTDAGMPDREGASVFYKDSKGAVFHTYSCYARGIDMLNGTYHVLDMVPKGRDEDPDDSQSWVRYHDRYND
jgi:predicted dithiol-disulfide oxidoreductase (DUF899 family)